MPKPAHRRGSYQRDAARVRALAYADTSTRCHRCGKTLAEHRPHRNGTPATWDAGHIEDGRAGGALVPEASTCNRSAGASDGNRRRKGLVLDQEW